MALNIDLDSYFSDSDSSKLLLGTAKHLSITSPTSSESSVESGISSLNSDELKKASPSSQDDDQDRNSLDGEISTQFVVQTNDEIPKEPIKTEEKICFACLEPKKLIYQNRDLLDLSYLKEQREIVQYTVLPENNLNSFFQNRAQYWRLNQNDHHESASESCDCCEFQYPLIPTTSSNDVSSRKDEITRSLLKYLQNEGCLAKPSHFDTIQPTGCQTAGGQNQNQHYQQLGYNNSFNFNSQSKPLNSKVALNIQNFSSCTSQNAFQNINSYNNTHHTYYNENNSGLYRHF